MTELLLIASGVAIALVGDWILRFWRQAESAYRRRNAETVLSRYGMTVHLYLATIGTEDAGLRNALDEFGFKGHVVLDSSGNVVGKLVPKLLKGPYLRLVVDNTK